MDSSLRFFFWGILFFTVFADAANAQTIHLILAVDGNSGLGGKNMSSDMRNMRQVFERNVPEGRLRVERLPIDDLTAGKMVETVEKLEVKHHDSIVFYYSGEGGYVKDRDEAFFQLPGRESLSRIKIEKLLRKKNIRLVILLTDCCQSPIPIPVSPVEKDTEDVERPEDFPPLFKTLFVESVGFVDLASCRPGEPSYVDPSHQGRGSYFTRCLVKLLENGLKRHEFDWKNLAKRLDEKVLQRVKEEILEKYPSVKKPQRVLLRSVSHHSRRAAGGVRFGAVVFEDDDSSDGLLVTHVFEGSPAAQNGLQVGDRILAINDTEVSTEKACQEIIKAARDAVEMSYFSSKQGRKINITVPLAY